MAKLHHPHAGLLIVRAKKQTMVPLTKDVTSIGRKQADIILDDPKVSSMHAEIRKDGHRHLLIDLKSTNGTYVNRKPVQEVELADQDVIEIGLTTLCFFEDARDYHGQTTEETAGFARPKDLPSQPENSVITSTKTLTQAILELEILEGPQKGDVFRFQKPHITIGRNDTDVALPDLDVSRSHALIEVLGKTSVFLRDLGSTNGTFVRGKRVQFEKIQNGDEITVGNTKLKIRLDTSFMESK